MSETPEKAQKICPRCNSLVDTDARFCKHCAFDLGKIAETIPDKVDSSASQNSIVYGILLLVGGIVVLTIVYFAEADCHKMGRVCNTPLIDLIKILAPLGFILGVGLIVVGLIKKNR